MSLIKALIEDHGLDLAEMEKKSQEYLADLFQGDNDSIPDVLKETAFYSWVTAKMVAGIHKTMVANGTLEITALNLANEILMDIYSDMSNLLHREAESVALKRIEELSDMAEPMGAEGWTKSNKETADALNKKQSKKQTKKGAKK